jgi:hypothetical protein
MPDRPYLALIDHETNGQRCDVTPLFADYSAFSALVDDLAVLVEPLAFDVVAGIDALGFIKSPARIPLLSSMGRKRRLLSVSASLWKNRTI